MPDPLRKASTLLGVLALSSAALGCGGPLELGSDLLWSAGHESGDLSEWTRDGSGQTRLPAESTTVATSTERARTGRFSLALVNPATFRGQPGQDPPVRAEEGEEGPELFHDVGALEDAYYSAWFFVEESYRVDPAIAIMRLGARDAAEGPVALGPELHLRSLAGGDYVLVVYSRDLSLHYAPVAAPAPRVEARRWFHLETRYEPRSLGRVRVWLDGTLVYDLQDRPRAGSAQVVFSVCNISEFAELGPVTLFADDAAVSLTRVTPQGRLTAD